MFVTSIWIQPTLLNVDNEARFNELVYDLWSAAWQALRFKSLGYELCLTTDFAGKQYFQHLPYAQIREITFPSDYLYLLRDLHKVHAISIMGKYDTYIDLHCTQFTEGELCRLKAYTNTPIICGETLLSESAIKTKLDISNTIYDTSVCKLPDLNVRKQFVESVHSKDLEFYNLCKQDPQLTHSTEDFSDAIIGSCLYKTLSEIPEKVQLSKGKLPLDVLKSSVKWADQKLYDKLIGYEKNILDPTVDVDLFDIEYV